MELKIGDLLCSKRHEPAGYFDLGIVTHFEESENKDGWVWIYIYVVDWDDTLRYGLTTAQRYFDLLARA